MTTADAVPAHLLLGPPRHGVRLLAGQLAGSLGAPVVEDWAAAARHRRVHLHVTDRLAGSAGIRRLAASSQTTVTLHDVPQPTDGGAFARRREVYREIVAATTNWAVSSEHERRLVHRHLRPVRDGLVAPLPVIEDDVSTSSGPADWPTGRTAAVFGFVYPGKGHAELIDAVAALDDDAAATSVVAVGAVAPGHDDLAVALEARARTAGVEFTVTGHLEEPVATALLRRADVGVCGHRNVSASGSINSWVAAGRRPLVRDGSYARELSRLRPRCYRRYRDGDLVDQLRIALERPETTWLEPHIDTRPHLADTARCYLDWWRRP